MVAKARVSHLFLAGLLTTWTISMTPLPTLAHPMGNFSISHYAGIRVEQDGVEVQYLIDMAEIPTFQEIQENGIVPQRQGHRASPDRSPRASSWEGHRPQAGKSIPSVQP